MQAYTVREVIEMMKLSEVGQTVGVTRRTLQAYAKIGLLEPTKKTIGGYWYYRECDFNDYYAGKIGIRSRWNRNGHKNKKA